MYHMTKDAGKKIVAQKIEDFTKNAAVLKKKGHGETNTRTNYIDVLFEALGWDMKSHYDVVREFSQKDMSGTKKVDYAFKINGKLKFFVEAKEASIDLVNDKDSIYQAKRYAYSTSGKAPIVILTDFEEFRVFNVIKAPDYNNTDRELLKKHCLVYTDYAEHWDLLWDTFSKEAVAGGSLDVLRGKIDKNTKTMDVDFLEQITAWRETLAKNIALRNKELSVDELNEAVQRILDRLLFIRNLEDREIEAENTLFDKTKKTEEIYKSIVPIFRSLDNTYNGLLFKKHFSEDLNIDDKTIKDLIKSMCYPVSPFQLDVIEPEILGRIYEKFLGSKIRLTENHQAKVEEKIEVRKAGGVYYTPEYIVSYIVENTVGKKIEGLSPDEIKKIKIVDPACGSGSFLLGAYSYILEYHTKWYAAHSKDKAYKNDYYLSHANEVTVNLEKRGDILRNNIFGVDIDQEATEVAIMSLYLKMLADGFDKGEKDLFFVKGHVLPDMTANIKCGNSLIGTDYFDGRLDIDMAEMKEIKPFDWDEKFPEIFKNGGFDCVIGNPPYGAIYHDSQKEYLKKTYSTPEGRFDNFEIFIEKGVLILNKIGLLSFIIPSPFLTNLYSRKLREYILSKCSLNEVVSFSMQVFEDPTVHTCIILLGPINNNETNVAIKNNINSISELNSQSNFLVDQNDLKTNLNCVIDVFIDPSAKAIFGKLSSNCIPLGELCYIRQCIKTGDDDVYITNSDKELKDPWKKSLRGKSIERYYTNEQDLYLKYGDWLARNWKNKTFYETNKIAIRETGKRITATLDLENRYFLSSIYAIYFKESSKNNHNDLHILLAILNSEFSNYFIKLVALNLTEGAFTKVRTNQLARLPVPKDCNQGELATLVDQMLLTQKEYHHTKSDSDKKLYEQKIAMLDKKIDALVYQLYDLTPEEIKIVEGEK